ncbi:hypothetical protein AR457_23150 [Streptomyces agglomeratus]|nr:hypothetical protein BGK70_13505 [Streptomyces agglomeratus]OEJ46593.1 hypothetical protein AR457_23150 [Streptomyces agglomeratus]
MYQDPNEAAWYREVEFRRITRTLDGLYDRQRAEGDSVLLRQRVGRLEALQQALMGFPAALSQ